MQYSFNGEHWIVTESIFHSALFTSVVFNFLPHQTTQALNYLQHRFFFYFTKCIGTHSDGNVINGDCAGMFWFED
jgi:hypothetical protein